MALLRHGLTKGNLTKCYIGVTEEPLCEEGIEKLLQKKEQGAYQHAERIYCSPMLRCQMTAKLLYPNQEITLIPDFRECDFGAFEGKNYQQLSSDSRYQQWIDSNGMAPFPGGEAREDFEFRCQNAFHKVVKDIVKSMKDVKDMKEVNDVKDILKDTVQERQRLFPLEEKRGLEHKSSSWDAVCIVHGGTIMAILAAFAMEKKDYYAWNCGNGGGYEILVQDDGTIFVVGNL